MTSQKINVFNPFEHDINPSEFDFAKESEYDSEIVKIWAIVSGASQGGWSGHKLFNQQTIDLKSWKLSNKSTVNRSDLLVLRNVEKSHDFFNDIPKFSCIEIEVYLNSRMDRAVMLSGRVIQNLSDEMLKEITYVKSVKPLSIDDLRDFKFNHDMQFFENKIKWLDKEITISIDVDDESKITDEIETLKILLSNQQKYLDDVLTYATKHILAVKNESWLEPDESPMTEEEFVKRSLLETIRIYRQDGFEFSFSEEEEIFSGGYFMINGTTKNGADSYDIGF